MAKQDTQKGLAGLSSMITDVHWIEQHAREQVANMPKDVHTEDKLQKEHCKASRQNQKMDAHAPQSNGYGYFAVIGLVFLLIILFAAAGGKNSTSSEPQRAKPATAAKSSNTYSAQPIPKPAPTPAPKPVPESLPMPAPTPAKKLTAVQKTPIQVLQSFHQNITQKRYREAYNCLSEDFQDSVSYEGWIPGFRTTISSSVSNVKITSQTDSQTELTYILKAVDYPGGTRYFRGTATLIKTPDGWKIDEIINRAQ